MKAVLKSWLRRFKFRVGRFPADPRGCQRANTKYRVRAGEGVIAVAALLVHSSLSQVGLALRQ
jgi:hypothetical protein